MKLVAATLSFLLLASAGFTSPIVGNWNCTADSFADDFYFSGVVEYRKNGQAKYTATLQGELPDGRRAVISLKTKGKWEMDGDKLFESNFRNTRVTRFVLDGVDVTRTRLKRSFEANLAKSFAEPDAPSIVKFTDNNNFIEKGEDIVAKCTRVGSQVNS